MSLPETHLWRVRRIDNGEYERVISNEIPTVAPSDNGAIDPDQTVIIQAEYTNILQAGYINIESQLADNQAISINASDPAGGIDINAGSGGITIDTTNVVSIDAGAQINITTTAGNILVDTPGLVNINGQSGVNIGNNSDASPVNIGTGPAAKNITIGNTQSTTSMQLSAGSAGIHLDTASGGDISIDAIGATSNFTVASNGDGQDLIIALTGATNSSILLSSTGTGADAIGLSTSSGGIQFVSAGQLDLVSNQVAGGAITLDTAFSGGGITLSSGSFGMIFQVAFGGLMNIGDDTGTGNINVGTGARERTVTIGSITGASATLIRAGTAGTSIGGESVSNTVSIGDVAQTKTIIIGNTSANTRIVQRWGASGMLIRNIPAETSLADSSTTLTVAQLKTGILRITPTLDRTLTLPTAANIVADWSGWQVGDSFDFTIMNQSSSAIAALANISAGTGGTIIGSNTVRPVTNVAVALSDNYFTSGSSTFRLRLTNVSGGTEAYTVYRVG